MAEYIEREAFAAEMKKRQDAAKEWLIEANGIDDADGKARAETILSFLCEVKLTLDAIPAADVVPVRHGKWKWEFADNGWANHICSECGYTKNTDIHVRVGYHYCPNCGARMDGDGNG